MQLIMSNPTERDLVRARRDAQFDHRTQINAARKDAKLEVAKGMKAKGRRIPYHNPLRVGQVSP